MRWIWLRAALLGLLIGPAPAPAKPGSAEPSEAEQAAEIERRSSARTSGQAVRGPGFHVWDEDSQVALDWALELRQAAYERVESGRWKSMAARSAARPSILTGEVEVELASWIEASPAGEAGQSPLGLVLCLLPSLDRTCLISSCATCSDEQTRIALALALAAPFEAVGVRGAIDHLEKDPSARVRKLARYAAASRRAHG